VVIFLIFKRGISDVIAYRIHLLGQIKLCDTLQSFIRQISNIKRVLFEIKTQRNLTSNLMIKILFLIRGCTFIVTVVHFGQFGDLNLAAVTVTF